ncbi:MAG: hypothetical protein ACTHK2_19365 [Dokdonella sp.]|uniref:hypothetical protein n=1 Tax=Dokdonella sp. TaxID=2291710 RepID=UPI003F7F161E
MLCALIAGAPLVTAMAEPLLAPRRVLFVGNSLVYYNDLPRMTAALAAAGDVVLDTSMIAGAGTTMREHLDRGTMQQELARAHYDAVVLQDRGGYPLCGAEDRECAGSIAAMCEAAALVRKAGARPVWFGTWQGAADAQAALSKAGARAAKDCGVPFADVGAAMQRFVVRSRVRPWLDDGHPDTAGSWVAAPCSRGRSRTNVRMRPIRCRKPAACAGRTHTRTRAASLRRKPRLRWTARRRRGLSGAARWTRRTARAERGTRERTSQIASRLPPLPRERAPCVLPMGATEVAMHLDEAGR